MRLLKTKFLGIGIAPSARLHVATGSVSTGSVNQRWFDFSNSLQSQTTATTDVCAIFDSSIWCKGRFAATRSDIRIEKNIADIRDDSALQKILEIQPKTYNYIDVVNRGDQRVYGFIAQQINDVLPEAVAIQKDIRANIYQVCDLFIK